MGDTVTKPRLRKRKSEERSSSTGLPQMEPSDRRLEYKQSRKRKKQAKVRSLESVDEKLWIQDSRSTKPQDITEETLSPSTLLRDPYCTFLKTAREAAVRGVHPKDMNLKLFCDAMTLGELAIENIWESSHQPGLSLSAPIIFQYIYEDEFISLALLHIHNGCGIPLHDHPKMNGFSYLLAGNLQHNSYTMDKRTSSYKAGWCSVHSVEQTRSDAMITDNIVDNIHSLSATTNCSILQLLVPGYSKERKCTYYKIVEASSERAWLEPTRAPATYRTKTFPYLGRSFCY